MTTQTYPSRFFTPLSTHNVSLPDHLTIKTTRDKNLLTDFNVYGYDGYQWFGTAFIQGNRLQFTTAMPISTMLKVSDTDQSKAGSGVSEVKRHANRPRVPSQGKSIRKYLEEYACKGTKFILPAFTFNFGEEESTAEDAPSALLVLYADENESSSNGWPALFQLPTDIKLDTTDGAHRRGEIEILLDSKDPEKRDDRENLRRNAVDVKIVFERKRIDSHQDFADCAKAKPIAAGLVTTFDVRETRNRRAVELVQRVQFLEHYVDATASNVNLSANSAKIWSMSAVRGFVSHVNGVYPPPVNVGDGSEVAMSLEEQLQGAEDFFSAVIEYMPQLKALDEVRLGRLKDVSPGTYRNKRGGDVALRGLGMSLFARAFVYGKQNNMPFVEVAKRLGQVDWHLLDCERADLPSTDTEEGRAKFHQAVQEHANPIWAALLSIGEARYKIGSSNEEASLAWSRITAKHFPELVAQAAE